MVQKRIGRWWKIILFIAFIIVNQAFFVVKIIEYYCIFFAKHGNYFMRLCSFVVLGAKTNPSQFLYLSVISDFSKLKHAKIISKITILMFKNPHLKKLMTSNIVFVFWSFGAFFINDQFYLNKMKIIKNIYFDQCFGSTWLWSARLQKTNLPLIKARLKSRLARFLKTIRAKTLIFKWVP